MAVYEFHATHGVTFGGAQPWAQFGHAPELSTPDGQKRYRFTTTDAAVARRLRKVDGYGITEVKREAAPDVHDGDDG